MWPEKSDAEVGARHSKAGSLCKINLLYVKWGLQVGEIPKQFLRITT